MTPLECQYCKKKFKGRIDKKFCTTQCRNKFNYQRRKATKDITKEIDSILHRNRILLQTIMGEKRQKMKIARLELEKIGFNFNYITGIYKNSKNKIFHYVYDFAWMEFSTQEILIIKNSKTLK